MSQSYVYVPIVAEPEPIAIHCGTHSMPGFAMMRVRLMGLRLPSGGRHEAIQKGSGRRSGCHANVRRAEP